MNKSIGLSLLMFLLSMSSYGSVDLNGFHNINFNATGLFCGLHLEVSGDSLIATNIIPPGSDYSNSCGAGGHSSQCRGQSALFKCDSEGQCFDRNGELALVLLQDGNFFSLINNSKYIFNMIESKYYVCK